VGLDSGYVRATHKQGWFEVIAGKTVVAFRRTEKREVPADKCFGFVQTYDDKSRRRLWELLFRCWYPRFRPQPEEIKSQQKAA